MATTTTEEEKSSATSLVHHGGTINQDLIVIPPDFDMNKETSLMKPKAKRQLIRKNKAKYPVKYDDTYPWEFYDGVCDFCTRTVYFDSHHRSKKGEMASHDRIVMMGDDKEVVSHPAHCPELNATTIEDKMYYAMLRKLKGMESPWFWEKERKKKEREEKEKKNNNKNNKELISLNAGTGFGPIYVSNTIPENHSDSIGGVLSTTNTTTVEHDEEVEEFNHVSARIPNELTPPPPINLDNNNNNLIDGKEKDSLLADIYERATEDKEENTFVLSQNTMNLLGLIVGDAGDNEGVDDVIYRIAKFYLKNVRLVANYYDNNNNRRNNKDNKR